MVVLWKYLRDCFVVPPRNDVKNYTNTRHCEPIRRSNLLKSAIAFIILITIGFASLDAYPQSTIKIGFLIRDKRDIAIQQTAQLAIQEANAHGGYKGQKFELVTRSCDGPWGMTSKQAVALIYEDQVPIVVTALDGRNAHLAEQVTAKSHVVMLSTLSSDPTLSKAYVPWYFRMVPDDEQQAEVLVDQIYQKDGAKEVAVISLDDYDGKTSTEAFLDEAKEKGYPVPNFIHAKSEEGYLTQINKVSWDAVVIAGSIQNPPFIIENIRAENIYAFQNVLNFINSYDPVKFDKIIFPTISNLDQGRWLIFEKSYLQKFNTNPSPSSAFIYDGILLAIESIKKYGPDSEAIRLGFKDLELDGITGKIKFGKLGNRDF